MNEAFEKYMKNCWPQVQRDMIGFVIAKETWKAATPQWEPEPAELAARFHKIYELLAPHYGYETREDTKQFDPESPNGKLMTAVCAQIIVAFTRTT